MPYSVLQCIYHLEIVLAIYYVFFSALVTCCYSTILNAQISPSCENRLGNFSSSFDPPHWNSDYTVFRCVQKVSGSNPAMVVAFQWMRNGRDSCTVRCPWCRLKNTRWSEFTEPSTTATLESILCI